MRIIKSIPIGQIDIDRTPLDNRTLEYANSMKCGAIFPPIKLQVITEGRWKVKDGRHRLTAAKLNKFKTIRAKYYKC